MSTSTVLNVIPIDLTANQQGDVPSTVVGDNPLKRFGYVAPAGATVLTGVGVLAKRARPRFGVGAEVINPSSGESLSMGASSTHDFNFSVSDEAIGKAKMLEVLKAHRDQVAAQTDAELATYVDAVYAWSKDLGNTSKQSTVDATFKVVIGAV